MTSRGCPFKCPYCSGGGIPLRSITPSRIADEVESCLALGIHDILFFDETFTMNKKRVLAICDEFIGRSLKIRWNARTRVDCIDLEIMKKMKKAGCRLLQFGIETGCERTQKVLGRNFKLDKIREVVKMARGEGILAYGNFMFNLPDETVDEMNQTIDFAIKLNLDYAVFGILSVYPKTEFYDTLLREKKIKDDFWRMYARDPFSYGIRTSKWPSAYTPEELDAMVKKAYAKFYMRPKFILQALTRDDTISQKYTLMKSGLKVFSRFFG
jgi:anaerobic magnesium-protoporphyrin IX monomethyl ester cyclase